MVRTRGVLSRRAVWIGALAFALGVGAGVTVAAHDEAPTTRAEWMPPDFDSPRVTGLPVDRARRILNAEGYDVMVVGRGEVKLQELGFEGQLLEIEGSSEGPRRYCASSTDRCVRVGAEQAR